MNTTTPRTDAVVGQREFGSLADSEYVRLARQLERELADVNTERYNLVVQRDQVLHLLQGGNALTAEDVIKSGLGIGVLSEQKHHEHMRCKAEKDRDDWKEIAEELAKNCELAKYYGATWRQATELRDVLARFNTKKGQTK